MFHLAGIPSYLVLAELAVKRVLRGQLPTPEYPAALRARAPRVWWSRADRTFSYARDNHAPYGRLVQCAGLVAQAVSQSAHAVLAARASGSPTKRPCSPGRACARSMSSYRPPAPDLRRCASS